MFRRTGLNGARSLVLSTQTRNCCWRDRGVGYTRLVASPCEPCTAPSLARDLENRFRALFECSSDAIFITDYDSAVFVEANPMATLLTGYSSKELRQMTGRHLHPAEDAAIVNEISRELIQGGRVHRPAVRLQRKDGGTFWADLKSSVYSVDGRQLYITFVRDISSRVSRETELEEAYRCLKEREAQLVRSSRLAAVGQVAAGIAHEINNPAASTLTNLELLQQDLDKLTGATRESQEILALRDTVVAFRKEASVSIRDSLEGIRRIASIVKGLRGFTRIEEDEVQYVDLNEVIRAASRLVHHQVRHIAVTLCALTPTTRIAADRGKLVQVIVNLLVNAAQAIDEAGGTCIEVSTRSTPEGVVLRIQDDGPGIPAHQHELVFEPFFTTKESDRGTGLGLSMCADIVEQHRGTIRLASSTLGGAAFEVFIPTETGLKPRPQQSTIVVKDAPPPRVLVVDDEVALVRAYRRSLGRRYRVVAAYGGEEALQILTRDEGFDVILCDLMMPGVDGVTVYETLRQQQPHLLDRLLFCTGGPTTLRCQRFLGQPGIALLQKPVSTQQLCDFIDRRVGARALRASARN